ncbi:hypothetical protein V8X51_002199 [Escherichia coli]|uniref:Uncharacterized protein n=1 Tax=Escherichia coli TaxID=562 RepID=A0AAP6AZS4_ECOLX|nr:hypothetical protein [Escherichia coli]HBC2934634.1 hypothetical protein [Escherichia coli O146]EER6268548.1 hypothetical protein [Escherichia coli]EEV2103096.1 hypothetical protein [Escherichia coli]EEW1292251.1 hypothetical protein [Escherichia coli]EEY7384456.1 hypothetical protein [Escherichia coli]
MDDQKKNSFAMMVTLTSARITEHERKRKAAREQARATELTRKELNALAREHREAPEAFALDNFLKSTCRKKIRTSGPRGHSS